MSLACVWVQTSLRERQRAQAARDESLFVAEPADACVHSHGSRHSTL